MTSTPPEITPAPLVDSASSSFSRDEIEALRHFMSSWTPLHLLLRHLLLI